MEWRFFSRKKNYYSSERSPDSRRLVNRNSRGFVRGYNLNRKDLGASELSERGKLQHLRVRRRKISQLLGAIALLMLMTAGLLLNLISRVVVYSDQSVLDSALVNYQKTTEEYFQANPAARLKFNLDELDLNQYVKLRHPEIKKLMFVSRGLNNYGFKILFRQPIATWFLNQTKYYVDVDGVAFTNSPINDSELIKIQDKSGVRQDATASTPKIISSRFLKFIGVAISSLKERQWQVSQVAIPPNTTHQLELRLEKHDFIIKMTVDRDPVLQVADLDKALKYIIKHQLKPQYLDVRIENKAYYK